MRILELSNRTDLLKSLDPKGCVKNATLTKGGQQLLIYVNEPNLYRIIFRSNKPEAKHFQDWIFNKVLPALRKYGHYEMPAAMQPPKDELSDKDLSKIRDFIYSVSGHFTYQNSFVSACWYSLRKVTGVKSPNKFEYKHLPVIIKELQRMQNIADYYKDVRSDIEAEIIKRIARDNGTSAELLEILCKMKEKLTNTVEIEKIRQITGPQSDLLLQLAS